MVFPRPCALSLAGLGCVVMTACVDEPLPPAVVDSVSPAPRDATAVPEVPCSFGELRCDGQAVVACREGGRLVDTGRACDPTTGELCRAGACVRPCEEAALAKSYVGCEYWPTTTLNAVGQIDFTFAVAVANPQTVPVRVYVERDENPVAESTIEPDALATIPLPWVRELSRDPGASGGESVLVRGAAYRLRSTFPVTVYQFSPLEYHGRTLQYSYSNDASLLLPTSALGKDYRAVSWPSEALASDVAELREPTAYASPGFVAIVATEDGTTVRLRARAKTAPGPAAQPALRAGEEATYVLDQGDVLQVLSNRRIADDAECSFPEEGTGGCTGGRVNDLSGSAVVADKPLAVFGGHLCAHIPAPWLFCDHLEEQLMPLDTWGTEAIAVSTDPQAPGETNVFRVLSGADGNRVEFEPPVRSPVTLTDGELVDVEHAGALRVTGTGRLQLVQYSVGGQHSSTLPADGGQQLGDPSMGLVVPVDQYRSEYTFLSPDTFEESTVNVVAPLGAPPKLDGAEIADLIALGSTGLGWTRVPISSGVHRIVGASAFGVTVSGVAPACSYLYPGGLDLRPLIR